MLNLILDLDKRARLADICFSTRPSVKFVNSGRITFICFIFIVLNISSQGIISLERYIDILFLKNEHSLSPTIPNYVMLLYVLLSLRISLLIDQSIQANINEFLNTAPIDMQVSVLC